ncbi:MAG: acyl CoA:acetate/3-ketoacid CoA transferase, partial [Mesorhizobium sp.]
VFSGNFNAGAKMRLENGKLVIDKEGKVAKIVPKVDQVSFSGARAVSQGQDVTYVTERCVIRLAADGLVVTEIAPGLDLERDVLRQAASPLAVSPGLKQMDEALFLDQPIGLRL